jgi:hypothetical protein
MRGVDPSVIQLRAEVWTTAQERFLPAQRHLVATMSFSGLK